MSKMVKTLHEPFSAGYYTSQGNNVISETHRTEFDEVIGDILQSEREHGTVFIKELAYCVVRQPESFFMYEDFFMRCKHVVLLRHPKETIPSLVSQMRKVYGEDCSIERIRLAIGISDLIDICKYLPITHTIQSEDLVKDPETSLKTLCEKLSIPFNEKMLTWEAGSLQDWKIWEVQGWHDRAIESTGFERGASTYERDEMMDTLILESIPKYEMFSAKGKVRPPFFLSINTSNL